MLLAFLQQQLPVAPWYVTAFLALLFIASGVVNVVQMSKSRQLERYKALVDAADKATGIYSEELSVVRQRCDRIESENKSLLTENVVLKSKTDLSRLQEQAEKFQRENQTVQQKIVDGLTEFAHVGTERFANASEILAKNTQAINDLGRHMTSEFEFHKKAFSDIASVLQAIDRRLPAVSSTSAN